MRAYLLILSVVCVSAIAATCSLAIARDFNTNFGSFCPPGSQMVWQGSSGFCMCPDGSKAYGNVPCGGGGYEQPQPQGTYCRDGGICPPGSYCASMPGKCIPEGSVDCGRYVCKQGAKCSSGGCIWEDEEDCGGGSSCPAGHVCWRASEDVAGVKKGQTKCPTPADRDMLEKLIAEQKEKRREEKKRADEEKRQKEEVKKQEAARVAEEKKRAAEQKKIDANSASIQKDEYALRLEASKRRMEELTRKAQAEAAARATRPGNWVQQQLDAMAKGESPPPTPITPNQTQVVPTVSGPSSQFVLKPQLQEQRTIPTTTSDGSAGICSTFSGTNLDGRGCSPPLGPEANADAARRQKLRDEEFRRAEEERRAKELEAAYQARLKEKARADAEAVAARDSQYTDVVETRKEGCGLNPAGRTRCLVLGQRGVWCTVCTVQRRCTKGWLGKINASCGPTWQDCDTRCHDL